MVDTSAFDQPEARGLRTITATLRVIVAVQCFGAAALRFLHPGESNIAKLLLAGERMGAEQLPLLDQITAGVLFACGMFSLTRPCWPVLGPLMLFFLSDSVAKLGQGQDWQYYLEPAEHAVRFALPFCLMLIDWYPPKAKFSLWRFMTAGSVARLAASLTFMGHGLIALDQSLHGGHFETLIQDASGQLLGRSVPDEGVSAALALIGAVDLAVALNLMITRSRAIAGWMVFWGLITAASRIFHFGPVEGVAQMAVRIANSGAPLVVFLYWTLAVREREHAIIPKQEGHGGHADHHG